MSPIHPTIWPIEPHTQAKHEILTYYLNAWFPILSAPPDRKILYVDGFAGPGEYAAGEDGSPILALKTARDHKLISRLTRQGVKIVFLFIEERHDRYANLRDRLATTARPDNFQVEVVHGSFEEVFNEQFTHMEQEMAGLIPSFFFVDPFGPTGFPMNLIEKIALQRSSEALINFSYQSLNQWFLNDPLKHPRLTELFGDDRWRPALDIVDPREKEDFLVAQYRDALKYRGWRGTNFRMINKHNQTQYYLFFGTKHHLGMQAMKSAMWSAAPEGSFQYSDLSDPNQPRLFDKLADGDYERELAETIFEARRGTVAHKEQLIQEELAWHPTALDRHLTSALKLLEYESSPSKIVGVRKEDGTKRRARSYPKGCSIVFAD